MNHEIDTQKDLELAEEYTGIHVLVSEEFFKENNMYFEKDEFKRVFYCYGTNAGRYGDRTGLSGFFLYNDEFETILPEMVERLATSEESTKIYMSFDWKEISQEVIEKLKDRLGLLDIRVESIDSGMNCIFLSFSKSTP